MGRGGSTSVEEAGWTVTGGTGSFTAALQILSFSSLSVAFSSLSSSSQLSVIKRFGLRIILRNRT